MAGLVVSQTDASGGYSGGTGPGEREHASRGAPALHEDGTSSFPGELESSLTAATLYGTYTAGQRLELWGAAGYGRGDLTLALPAGPGAKADLDWTMASMGARSDLIQPGSFGGLTLALISDALWARTTSSDATEGSLNAAQADVTRLRLGLEGSWALSMSRFGEITPTLELGVRHDGGDAETGLGVEIGAGLAWAVPNLGLSLDVSGRTLVTHADESYENKGFSAGLTFDPDPGSAEGLSLQVRHELGGASTGGLDAMFASEAMQRMDGVQDIGAGRWTAEAAWGFMNFGGRFIGSPYAGYGTYDMARDYRMGWLLSPADANGPGLVLGLHVIRTETANEPADHGIQLELTLPW